MLGRVGDAHRQERDAGKQALISLSRKYHFRISWVKLLLCRGHVNLFLGVQRRRRQAAAGWWTAIREGGGLRRGDTGLVQARARVLPEVREARSQARSCAAAAPHVSSSESIGEAMRPGTNDWWSSSSAA